jgi:hypothetical protein
MLFFFSKHLQVRCKHVGSHLYNPLNNNSCLFHMSKHIIIPLNTKYLVSQRNYVQLIIFVNKKSDMHMQTFSLQAPTANIQTEIKPTKIYWKTNKERTHNFQQTL